MTLISLPIFQMENNERTKSPWFLDGPYRIDIESNPDLSVEGIMVMSGDPEDLHSFPIARVTGPAYAGREDTCDPELIANAEFIVRACNSHDTLMSALRVAANAIKTAILGENEFSGDAQEYEFALGIVHSAIAEATDGKSPLSPR